MNAHEDQFKFEVDTHSHTEPYRKETHQISGRSNGAPILLIMVLILVVTMGAGFFYLNHRFANTLSSAIEVSNLSQKQEHQFSSLLVKQARLEAALEALEKELAAKLSEIEQANDSLNQKADQQYGKSMQALTQKVGSEEFQNAMATFANKLGALKTDLNGLAGQLASDQNKLEELKLSVNGRLNEFEMILNETAKGVIDLKTDLADVAKNQLDANALDQEIKRQLSPVNKRIGEYKATAGALTGRFQDLEKKITRLQKNSAIYEREILKLRGQMNDLQRQVNRQPLPTEKIE